MDLEEFQSEFAQILNVDPSEITPETELSALKSWDSMNVLLYMTLAEEKFGESVSPDAITAAKTVGDLYRLAAAKN